MNLCLFLGCLFVCLFCYNEALANWHIQNGRMKNQDLLMGIEPRPLACWMRNFPQRYSRSQQSPGKSRQVKIDIFPMVSQATNFLGIFVLA